MSNVIVDYLGHLWNIFNSQVVLLILGFVLINIVWNEVEERRERKYLRRAIRNELRSIDYLQTQSDFLMLPTTIWFEIVRRDVLSDYKDGLQANLFTFYSMVADKNNLIQKQSVMSSFGDQRGVTQLLVYSYEGKATTVDKAIEDLSDRINNQLGRVLPAIDKYVN